MESSFTENHVKNNIFISNSGANYQNINNLSGVLAGQLTQAVWNITDRNLDAVIRLCSVFENLNKNDMKTGIVDMMFLFDDLFDFSLKKEITDISVHSEALDYFISEFLVDINDVMDELLLGD